MNDIEIQDPKTEGDLQLYNSTRMLDTDRNMICAVMPHNLNDSVNLKCSHQA